MSIESDIKNKALALGFDAVGMTTADPIEQKHVDYYTCWLEEGRAAEMGYLYRNIEKRFDPAKLLVGAKSVICVALNYRPVETELNNNPNVRIARYAQYEDYHPFIKERLFQLADFIKARRRESPDDSDTAKIRFKACVDSVPSAERALAQRAGLGFIGKNHMLIHPELGGQILLGELITTLPLEPDTPLANQSCGACNRCLAACPTGALAPDGSFDARKCISYLTIEAGNATVPVTLENTYGRDTRVPNYIFGCDECLLACPHEKNAPPRHNKDFQHHQEWQKLSREQIQSMIEEDFQKTFTNSGFIRLGLERLKRNVAVIR